MKRVLIIGIIVSVVASTAVFGFIQASNNALVLPGSTQYVVWDADGYTFEIPVDWQLQPANAFLDGIINAIIYETAGGRIYDIVSYDYAEPGSLVDNVSPTAIAVFTAKSGLAPYEYEGVLLNTYTAISTLGGMDFRLIDSRQGSLDGRPAIMLEYVFVFVADPDRPTIKGIEITTTTGTTMHAIAYAAELDEYDKYLHNFEHAVETFRFN